MVGITLNVSHNRHHRLFITESVGVTAWVGCNSSQSVCLSVCREHNSKTKDPKVFKVGIGNEPGIY